MVKMSISSIEGQADQICRKTIFLSIRHLPRKKDGVPEASSTTPFFLTVSFLPRENHGDFIGILNTRYPHYYHGNKWTSSLPVSHPK
jgi:hypothetical protein